MNWRVFSRKFGEALLVALGLVVVLSPVARAFSGSLAAAPLPGLAFGFVLSVGTARALREGLLPGAVTRPWPADWKEVDVRDVRRQLLRASALVLMITAVTVVAPLTYAVTASLLGTLLVTVGYVAMATVVLSDVYAKAHETIAELRTRSQAGPPTFAWEPDLVLVLRYPLLVRILATFLGICAVVLVGLLNSIPVHGTRWGALLVSLGMLALAAYLILEPNLVSLVVDQLGIVHRSPWRRRRSIPWSEVRGHSRFEFDSYLIIETEQGRVWVSDYLSRSRELGLRLWLRVLK